MERKEYLLLTINPGSTSTKVAVFLGDKVLHEKIIRHQKKELNKYSLGYPALLQYRMQ